MSSPKGGLGAENLDDSEAEWLIKLRRELQAARREFGQTVTRMSSPKGVLGAENLDDSQAEWLKKLMSKMQDQVDNASTAYSESIKENKESMKSFSDLVTNLTNQIIHLDKFRTESISLQVSMKSELKNQLGEMKGGFVKNKEVVDDLQNQLTDMHKKVLNEQQLTQTLTVKVEEISGHCKSLQDKVNQLQSDIRNMSITQSSPPLQPTTGPQIGPMPEWMLRQRKQSNIIIFGLPELQDGNTGLLDQLGSLWIDIGISDLGDGSWSAFRVGKSENGRKRPVIVKFLDISKKFEILLNAKNLKGKAKWAGVAISHDLTKLQCLQEREKELHLRLEAEERNTNCPDIGGRRWRVVGVRGSRRIMLVHENATLMSSV